MIAAVRYYSGKGNTKRVAEAIAEEVKTEAVFCENDEAVIDSHVDVLFIGSGLYAHGIDKKLRTFIESLDAAMIGKAVIFSTSWISRHAIELIREALLKQGIPVQKASLYIRSNVIDEHLEDAKEFAKRSLRKTTLIMPEENTGEKTLTDSGSSEEIPEETLDTEEIRAESIYEFTVKDNQGNDVSLSDFTGKVLLIVNTATRCGFTPQYDGLEALYEKYKEKGFEILDFPCNQFAFQAPGSDEKIDTFCKMKFNTKFPRFAKIRVNGKDADPLYIYLKQQFPGRIKWNFAKFLIDRQGHVAARFSSKDTPEALDPVIEEYLNKE